MSVYEYIKKNGVKHAIEVAYKYKIDIILIKILGLFLKDKPLQDVIMIESHNDFDSNGGAFYRYLIENGYNNKYKIVWLVKHYKETSKNLPYNVICVREYGPDIRKDYYRWIAKWFLYDMNCQNKLRDDQISVYQTHGSLGLKNCVGVINLPNDLDYCLVASEYFARYEAEQYSWKYPNDKFRFCGFPSHDVFYSDNKGDLNKIIQDKFVKTILWMPTFSKSIEGRCDNASEQPFGIPLVKTTKEYFYLNRYLEERNVCLIIKLHPKQDLTGIKKINTSNIIILTGEDVRKKHIDNYKLMKDCDALISDYSSVAHEFLHTQRPIAYDLSDLSSYKRGIIVENPRELIAGYEIKVYEDLLKFINDIVNDIDPYIKQRAELFDRLFKYKDGKSSERVCNLLEL